MEDRDSEGQEKTPTRQEVHLDDTAPTSCLVASCVSCQKKAKTLEPFSAFQSLYKEGDLGAEEE